MSYTYLISAVENVNSGADRQVGWPVNRAVTGVMILVIAVKLDIHAVI